ncbi:hypothetical protein [Aquipuribacter hungaricus]|uniref:Uncharacterized protein n=1 Tax=Aquipuribacter hungaricus TaxID=545624 RepID=A0ABV7WHR1_9MICO
MTTPSPTPSPTPTTPTVPDAAAARSAVAGADALGARARQAGGWYARYMLVFGAGFGVMTLLLGLGPDSPRAAVTWMLVLVPAWACFMVGMVVWATRRPVQGELRGRAYVPGWVGTGVLYALALAVGTTADLPVQGWFAAAVVVPLPLVLSAVRLRRSLR